MKWEQWEAEFRAQFLSRFCIEPEESIERQWWRVQYENRSTPTEACDYLKEKRDLIDRAEFTLEDAIDELSRHVPRREAEHLLRGLVEAEQSRNKR